MKYKNKFSILSLTMLTILVFSLSQFQTSFSQTNVNEEISVVTEDGNYEFLVTFAQDTTNVTWIFNDGITSGAGVMLITPHIEDDGFNMLYWDSFFDVWTEIDVIQYRETNLLDEIVSTGSASGLNLLGQDKSISNIIPNQIQPDYINGTKTITKITFDRDGDLIFGSLGDQFVQFNTSNFEFSSTDLPYYFGGGYNAEITELSLFSGDFNNIDNNFMVSSSFGDFFEAGNYYSPRSGAMMSSWGAYGISFDDFMNGAYNFSYYTEISDGAGYCECLETQAFEFKEQYYRSTDYNINMNNNEYINGYYTQVNNSYPKASQNLQTAQTYTNPLYYSTTVYDWSNTVNSYNSFWGNSNMSDSITLTALNKTGYNQFNGTVFDTATTPAGLYTPTGTNNFTVDASSASLNVDYFLRNLNLDFSPSELNMSIFNELGIIIGFEDSSIELQYNNFWFYAENRGDSGLFIDLAIDELFLTIEDNYILYEIGGLTIFTDISETSLLDLIMIDSIPIMLHYYVTTEYGDNSGLALLVTDGMSVPPESITEYITIAGETITSIEVTTVSDVTTVTDSTTVTDVRTETVSDGETVTETEVETITITPDETNGTQSSPAPISNLPVVLGLITSMMIIRVIARKKE